MKQFNKPGRMVKSQYALWFMAFLGLFILFYSSSKSQSLDFTEKSRWVHFTTYSGLPAGEINGIFESSDSTLWVSTLQGLACFDGYRWRSGDSSAGWPTNKSVTIRGEYHDSILILFSGTEFLGNKNGFRKIIERVHDSVTIIGKSFHPSDEYTALFTLYSDYFRNKPDPDFVKTVKSFYPAKNGSLWITRNDGLYRWDGNQWRFRFQLSNPRALGSVILLSENNSGSGICLERMPTGQTGMWEWIHNGPFIQCEMEHQYLYMTSADIDDSDNVVSVSQGGEIYVRTDNGWKILPFFPDNPKNITKVLFRKNGDLCVGSDEGISIWRRSFNTWTTLPQSSTELKNCIDEILLTRKGDLWIGSANGFEIRYADGRVEDKTVLDNKRILNITGLQEDDDGNIWISSGSSFDGAYKWDGKSWTYYPIQQSSQGIYVHKIRKDKRGRLWFLGLGQNLVPPIDDEPGAYVLDHGIFTKWGLKEGLHSARVYAFDEGDKGTFYFGTHKGICRFRDGAWTYWTTGNGLREDHVFCLAADHEGGIWFGHMNTVGLGYIDAHDSVHYFTTDDGIPDNRVYDIKVDAGGVVWVATHGGLCCYDHGQWSIFDEKSGLISNSLWPVLPLDHDVYVGTTGKGVAILNRDAGRSLYPKVENEKPIVENQNVYIRWKSFAYYGEVMPENSLTRYRINNDNWSPWNTTHEISYRELAAGQYTIGIQGKGLYGQFNPVPENATFIILPPLYLRPIIYIPASGAILAMAMLLTLLQLRRIKHRKELTKSEERYRLITELMSDYAYLYHIEDEGRLNVLWITESFTRLTGYSIEEFKQSEFFERYNHAEDLPFILKMHEAVMNGTPESYEGRVKTKNGDTLWMHNHLAPIWNSDHTRVTHMYGIARDITRRKHDEEQMRMLATELSTTEERERRRMAEFLHDTIGQTLAFSKIKLRTIERSSTDEKVHTQIEEVRKLIEESIKNTRSLTFELSPPTLYELGLVESVRSLAEQMFAQHNIRLQFENEELSIHTGNELSIALYYAVREVLINIVKHSGATEVSIVIPSSNDFIRVIIRDNGRGIDPLPSGSPSKTETSFGLFNIRERLKHLGGSLEINSAPNAGTTITLTIPLTSGDIREEVKS
ncbi:MAG: ATP-binding protein [Bacteroidota bacterium]